MNIRVSRTRIEDPSRVLDPEYTQETMESYWITPDEAMAGPQQGRHLSFAEAIQLFTV
jgi:hypothetical protein